MLVNSSPKCAKVRLNIDQKAKLIAKNDSDNLGTLLGDVITICNKCFQSYIFQLCNYRKTITVLYKQTMINANV